MNVKNIFIGSELPNSFGNKFRAKRFKFLQKKFESFPAPVKILDVGGTLNYWVNRGFDKQPGFEITLLNMKKSESDHANIKYIVGDATDLSQFNDNSFDIVFSNSVIEHLYTKENQIKMAKEAMRVGKFYYVQTPNKYFIIEPHYLLPFFQFLPNKLQYLILTKTKFSRMKKWNPERAQNYIDEIRLLSKAEMLALFPSCNLYIEKVFGFAKSYSAHNFPEK